MIDYAYMNILSFMLTSAPGLRGCPELKASAWAESAGNKEKVVCVRAVG